MRRQLADTLDASKRETERVESELADLRRKLEAAPEAARESAQTIERILSQGLERLTSTAAEASDQAREIDAQFQARIRQNYELLSDFILRMGSVAGGRKPLDLPANEVPDPLSARRTGESRARTANPRPARDDDEDAHAERKPRSDDRNHQTSPDEPADDSAHDDAPARPAGAARDPGWRWRDLLANMDPKDEAEPDPDPAPRPRKR